MIESGHDYSSVGVVSATRKSVEVLENCIKRIMSFRIAIASLKHWLDEISVDVQLKPPFFIFGEQMWGRVRCLRPPNVDEAKRSAVKGRSPRAAFTDFAPFSSTCIFFGARAARRMNVGRESFFAESFDKDTRMTQPLRQRPPCCSNRLSVLWLAIAAVCLFAASGTAIADHEDGKDDRKNDAPATLSWSLESSHSALGSGGSDFYVRLRIKAAKVKVERPPLTLALVFDRSGSMNSDNKIGFVRKAGYLVTENLTRTDHVAIVAFNHEVQTLVPLHPVVSREYMRH